MTAENFAYWLQGALELDETRKNLSANQLKIIKRHLQLSMYYENNIAANNNTASERTKLNYPPGMRC